MKKIICAMLLAATAGTTAAAQGVQDWSGAYAGGSYASMTGKLDKFLSGVLQGSYASSGTAAGAFAGYNIQNNALVYGGELAFSQGNTAYTGVAVPLTETAMDAKARVGFAMNNVLVYAVGGGSSYTLDDGGTPSITYGYNYGAGAAVKFDSGMFIGAEYLVRTVQGGNPFNPNDTFTVNNQSVIARIGWQF